MSASTPKPPNVLAMMVMQNLQKALTGEPSTQKLNQVLRYLCKWRSQLIVQTLIQESGTSVISGPFKGMAYHSKVSEGSASARLLGCYEAALAPILEAIIERAYPVVMDIGCAEGYYAVGFARRMAQTQVQAFDSNPRAQKLCTALAKENGVQDRITVGGLATHADFDRCLDAKTLVFCDIEGAEADLLDPEAASGLKAADILVEVHDCFQPNLSQKLKDRFAKTHDITQIDRQIDMSGFPDWMERLSDLDRLLAVWEWRTGPTPWLWMTAKDS